MNLNQISGSYIIELFTGTAASRQVNGGIQTTFIKPTVNEWKRRSTPMSLTGKMYGIVPPYLRTRGLRIYELFCRIWFARTVPCMIAGHAHEYRSGNQSKSRNCQSVTY